MSEVRQKAIRTAWISIAGNFLLALVKGIAGILGNSFALIADAIESTTDIFVSALVLIGIRYSTKPPDEDHPYGHGRAEPLFTFIVVFFLTVAATLIAYESIRHIQTPHESPAPFTLIVLGAIIIIKELFYRIIEKKGEEMGSSVLKADAWHHRSDAITSLAAFTGIALALWKGEGWEEADDWAALVASGIIYYNAYKIFRPALGEIMDENMYEDFIKKIRKEATGIPGVVNTEKCLIRKTGMHYYIDLHITVSSDITVKEGHDIAHMVKDRLMEKFPEIADINIHVEPDIYD